MSKVDFRDVTFTISLVKIRFEKVPILTERASDHISILAETVTLCILAGFYVALDVVLFSGIAADDSSYELLTGTLPEK